MNLGLSRERIDETTGILPAVFPEPVADARTRIVVSGIRRDRGQLGTGDGCRRRRRVGVVAGSCLDEPLDVLRSAVGAGGDVSTVVVSVQARSYRANFVPIRQALLIGVWSCAAYGEASAAEARVTVKRRSLEAPALELHG